MLYNMDNVDMLELFETLVIQISAILGCAQVKIFMQEIGVREG
jgi:hypothetical protein